jgi:hypothetical protein
MSYAMNGSVLSFCPEPNNASFPTEGYGSTGG